jgi:hypothetical protein
LCFLLAQGALKHFEGRSTFEIAMLTQIDLGEASLPKQPQEAIVANVLAHPVAHSLARFREGRLSMTELDGA